MQPEGFRNRRAVKFAVSQNRTIDFSPVCELKLRRMFPLAQYSLMWPSRIGENSEFNSLCRSHNLLPEAS
jgi:hypothetical protein